MAVDLYIGTKKVTAKAVSRKEYNDYRGWEMPEDEADESGYLVEYLDSESNHPNHIGYITWSPSGAFNRAYRNIKDGITMGDALLLLKAGHKLARKGWNGKGMFLYYVPASTYPTMTAIAKAEFGEAVRYGAYIAMKTATGEVVPWLASQTDILAEDWVLAD